MSRIEEPGICYCSCHEPGVRMIHSVPCCWGRCPVCRKYAKTEQHIKKCHDRIEALMKEYVDGKSRERTSDEAP